MAEVIGLSVEIREEFLNQFIYEAGIRTPKYRDLVFQYLNSYKNPLELVLKTMEGIQVSEINQKLKKNDKSLVDLVTEETQFLAAPMPNLYFTRDNFASIGNGISLNHMYSVTRNRETIYAEYIFKYHPDFKDQVDKYYNRDIPYSVEGGDILNLNEHILAVGISQRTKAEAIDELAKNLFKDKHCQIDTVLAFNIPNSRAFMHLDTVFTQIDRNKFTYHPGIMDTLQVFEITEGNDENSDEDLNVVEINDSLENILSTYLKMPVTLIPCAGGDKVAAEREQWNDGSNTLCIAPGTVIVYDRNSITNQVLRENGLKVIEIPGAEISRGRGGPRCMSMPLIRED